MQMHAMTNGESRRQGWTGLINSMIGFTNAAVMFSIQQVENAVMMFTDSRKSVDRFQGAFDSLSHAMEREMDHDHRSTTEQMNQATMMNPETGAMPQEPDLAEETLAGRKK